jgi:hypothetical protein
VNTRQNAEGTATIGWSKKVHRSLNPVIAPGALPIARVVALFAALAVAPHVSHAQAPAANATARAVPSAAAGTEADALSQALVAACRRDYADFAGYLTAPNAREFGQLPEEQRDALLQRIVLQKGAGKPLLSQTSAGQPVVRCESGGVLTEMRFSTAETADNLAFISVEVPQAPPEARSIRFGLVRESGKWKLLSVGLLLFDIPAMSQQWAEADLQAREAQAVASLQKIADALKRYQVAYGRLAESLQQLGPAGAEGTSPEKAGLLDASLASGESDIYRFRYVITPSATGIDEAERNKNAGFALTATPIEYGKSGRRSFYLDSSGTLRGSDKQGLGATPDDPRIPLSSP